MNEHTEDQAPDEIEVERATENLIEAREAQAFVRGEMPPELVEARMKQMSRRSFLWGALAVGATVGGVKWIGSRRTEDGAVWPLRRALQNNEELWRDVFGEQKLAPTFPRSRARPIRINGNVGLSDGFDLAAWKLNVEGLQGAPATVTLDEIKALPKTTMTTQHKCIEGWATVVHWGGVKLSDFVRHYADKDATLPAYIGLTTPDFAYYVGMEMATALHPQTLLCYEMYDKPLEIGYGAPLRLMTPVKYGTKSLKRIGTLAFTDKRPADYWAERGYDYYAGL